MFSRSRNCCTSLGVIAFRTALTCAYPAAKLARYSGFFRAVRLLLRSRTIGSSQTRIHIPKKDSGELRGDRKLCRIISAVNAGRFSSSRLRGLFDIGPSGFLNRELIFELFCLALLGFSRFALFEKKLKLPVIALERIE